jgi:hypothetical protein
MLQPASEQSPMSRPSSVIALLIACPLVFASTGWCEQPAPQRTSSHVAAEIPGAVARMLGAYRFGAIAERVSLHAIDARQQIESEILLRVDAGDPRANRPARLRLEMGRLIVFAQGDRLLAVHTQNDEQYFEATLAGGLSAQSLAAALPEIPLPQLGFALTPRATEELAIEPEMHITGAGTVRWTSAAPLAGEASDTRLEFTNNLDSRLTAYTITKPGLTLRAAVEPVTGSDAKHPETWTLATTNRKRVPRLTDLRALPADVAIGDRVPTMGMHEHDLSGWSLTDALRTLHDAPPQTNAITSAAVICVLPGETVPTASILAARRGLSMLALEFDNQRRAGITTAPRLLVVTAGVLELDQITPAFIRTARERLGSVASDDTKFVWTSAGRDTLRRMAPGTTAATILIIDSQQRLRAVLPLDGTLADETTIAREVRAIVSEQLIVEGEQTPGNQDRIEGSGNSEEK